MKRRLKPVKVNRLIRLDRLQRNDRCSAGHNSLILSRIAFPSPDHIERLHQPPAVKAQYVILSCPYCTKIINGNGELTCFSGRKSYPMVFYAIANAPFDQPRPMAAWSHLEKCDYCKTQCRTVEVFQQRLNKYLSQMSWLTRRRVKKYWREIGILA